MSINIPDVTISESARAIIPSLGAFWFAASGLPLNVPDAAFPALALDERIAGSSIATLAEHPRIAPWRAAYRAMGLRPSDFRSSIEQLVRRELSGRPASGPTWLIDRYNCHSVSRLVPMGGYDLDRITDAAVVLRPSRVSDRFIPLGGSGSKMTIGGDVLVYAQEDELLCWALNHRDAAHSGLTATTRRALFIAEAVDAAGSEDAICALEAFSEELRGLGARCSTVTAFMVEHPLTEKLS